MEKTTPEFDPEAARLESLRGTLARVRSHRRLRVATRGCAAVAIAIAAAVTQAPRDESAPDNTATRLPEGGPSALVVRSIPLRDSQRIVSVKSPALLVSSAPSPGLIVRTSQGSGKSIPRMGEAEFRDLLAAVGYGSVEIAGRAPQVFSLTRP